MSPSIISEDLYSDLPRIEDCSPIPLSLSLSHTHTRTHVRTQARARARTDARTQARTHARTCAHVIVIFHKFTLTRMSSTLCSDIPHIEDCSPQSSSPPTPTHPLPPHPPSPHTHTLDCNLADNADSRLNWTVWRMRTTMEKWSIVQRICNLCRPLLVHSAHFPFLLPYLA